MVNYFHHRVAMNIVSQIPRKASKVMKFLPTCHETNRGCYIPSS